MISATAAADPAREIPPATILPSALGNGFISSEKIKFAPVLFQISLKENIISVNHAGFTTGITILLKTHHSPAPSICAASISASGTIYSINCFIRNNPNEEPQAGIIIAQYVSIILSLLIIR